MLVALKFSVRNSSPLNCARKLELYSPNANILYIQVFWGVYCAVHTVKYILITILFNRKRWPGKRKRKIIKRKERLEKGNKWNIFWRISSFIEHKLSYTSALFLNYSNLELNDVIVQGVPREPFAEKGHQLEPKGTKKTF